MIPMKPTLARGGSSKRRKAPSLENLAKYEIIISKSEGELQRNLKRDSVDGATVSEVSGSAVGKCEEEKTNPGKNSLQNEPTLKSRRSSMPFASQRKVRNVCIVRNSK